MSYELCKKSYELCKKFALIRHLINFRNYGAVCAAAVRQALDVV